MSRSKGDRNLLFGGGAMIRGSAAPRLPAGQPPSCIACPLGSPWSGWSIRRPGRGCQGESVASRIGSEGLRAHGGPDCGARPRRGYGAVEERLSWAVEQGRIRPVRWLTILHGGIEPGGVIGPYETDAEQEALRWEEVRETTNSCTRTGKTAPSGSRSASMGRRSSRSFRCGFLEALRSQLKYLLYISISRSC